MTTENLRREARVDIRVPVTISRGKTVLLLETADVSFKGLFVRTANPPALRSLVRLRVTLADRELEVHAMAVHIVPASDDPGKADAREPGVGLQFWGLAGPERTAWDSFVGSLVHARRGVPAATAAPAAGAREADPALPDPCTPSGVHLVVTAPRASSK